MADNPNWAWEQAHMKQALADAKAAERKACAKIAEERAAGNFKAAAIFEKRYPRDPSWAASERCAAHEAQHIAAAILARGEGEQHG